MLAVKLQWNLAHKFNSVAYVSSIGHHKSTTMKGADFRSPGKTSCLEKLQFNAGIKRSLVDESSKTQLARQNRSLLLLFITF